MNSEHVFSLPDSSGTGILHLYLLARDTLQMLVGVLYEVILLRGKVQLENFLNFLIFIVFFLKNPSDITLVGKKLPRFIKIADTEVTPSYLVLPKLISPPFLVIICFATE